MTDAEKKAKGQARIEEYVNSVNELRYHRQPINEEDKISIAVIDGINKINKREGASLEIVNNAPITINTDEQVSINARGEQVEKANSSTLDLEEEEKEEEGR